jgi:hypothetical protein
MACGGSQRKKNREEEMRYSWKERSGELSFSGEW